MIWLGSIFWEEIRYKKNDYFKNLITFKCEILYVEKILFFLQKFNGQAKGVMSGGLFRPVINNTKVTCLPKDLPEFLNIDISGLDIGKVIRLNELKAVNPQLEFAIKENPVVCTIARPRVKTAGGN